MNGYNTNLAGEFYVLSLLHRFGADANLTLGNKKSVDIAIIRSAGDAITVDVKALAGKTLWPMDNFRTKKEKHFLVFVTFLGNIADPTALPEIYIVPSTEIDSLMYHAPGGNRKGIRLSTLRSKGLKFRDAWKQLL